MKTHKNLSQFRSRWLKKPFSSHAYDAWLIDKGSLTARLQQRYSQFTVQAVTVKYAKPMPDEAVLLRQASYRAALIREVLLMGNHKPVIFAHSVLPTASLRGEWNRLGKLGNKPLGATLFANPKVKRTPFNYKKLSANHALFQQATEYLMLNADTKKVGYLWARRSIFSLNRLNIMVTEVFLPQLLVSLTVK